MSTPRLARWLLALTLNADERSDVIANLDDLYRNRLRRTGALSAHAWYWGQALTFALRLRLSTRPYSQRRSDSRSGAREVMIQILEDVRFALRSFVRSPGFTLTVVGTLALGIGANTIIYAVVSATVLRPMPFPNPERLVWVWPSGNISLTLHQFTDVQPEIDRFANVTAMAFRSYAITGGDTPDVVSGMSVTSNHFAVFGTPPILGRALTDRDGVPGGEPVALISYELWRSHFGGDSAIVGQRVGLFTSASIPMVPGAFAGKPHTVVGVLPPRYQPFGSTVQVYTPLVIDRGDPNFTNMGELSVVGRLAPGVDAAQVQAELVRLSGSLLSLKGMRESILSDRVLDLREALIGSLRPSMLATLVAVGLVLLIACANVANLAMARTQARQRELSVRHALGASRGRIARQLLTESAVLAAMASAVGLVAAWALLPVAVRVLPHNIALVDEVGLDPSVLGFTAAVLVVTTLLWGSVPALRHSARLAAGLSESRRGSGIDRRSYIMIKGLVVTEIALAVVLAYGAGLLQKSFVKLTSVDTGFASDNVITMRLAPSEQNYRPTEVRRALYARVLEETRRIPGVSGAGAIHFLPIADGGPSVGFLVDPTDPENRQASGYRVVTPGYLEALRIPVLQGRTIDESDRTGSRPVGLVNRALADHLWPEGDALGQTLYRTSGRTFFTVVGIVGNVRQAALGLPPDPEMYIPLEQTQWASAMTIVARTANEIPGLEAMLRGIVRSVDPNLPITRVSTMDAILSQSVANPRFYNVLFSLFAILALVLAGIGVYGVVAYVVGIRSHEIGVQLALGATGGRILRGELQQGGLMAAVGIGLGSVAALAASRLFSGFLFQVSLLDPLVFALTTMVILAIALCAVAVPARRASRVDPLVSIRAE